MTVNVSDGDQLSQATMLTPDVTGQGGCLEPVTCGEVQIQAGILALVRHAEGLRPEPRAVVLTYRATRWPIRAYTWLANPAMPACEPWISQAVVPGLSFS